MPKPTVIFEAATIVVINKPAGLAVHGASPTDERPTVVSWLAARYPNLEALFPPIAGEIWRPGIVHRLDQDTSGVMVVAKTADALRNLQDQFRGRTTQKVYHALVSGVPDETGELSGAIARSDTDPTHQQIRRLSFSWSKGTAREAETTYRRLGVSPDQSASLLELQPKTGRMHQLRVQLAEAGWPILGDEKYGTKQCQRLSADLDIHRQLLHALRLSFDDPTTRERRTFSAPYPADIRAALDRLNLALDDDRAQQ